MLLKDCCNFQEGYVNPDKTKSEYFTNGTINWLKATDIKNNFIYCTEDKINEVGLNSCSNQTVFSCDSIVLSKSGTIGNIGILKCNAYGNRATINIIPNEEKVNPMFIYYLLSAKKEELKARAVGSIQKNLYISCLEPIDIGDFDRKTQDKIAEILSGIDEQINRNNEVVKKLQVLGNTIYSDTFKECNTTCSLTNFPYIQLIKQGIDEFIGEKYYVATADVVNEDFNFNSQLVTFDNKEGRANMQPIKNSVWFAQMKNSVKHIFVSENDDYLVNNYIFSTGFYGFQCDEIAYEFMIGTLSLPYFEQIKDKMANGAIMASINSDSLNLIKIPLPTKEQLSLYHRKTKDIYKQISAIKTENYKLSKLKEQILPLLINSQLSI